MKFNLVILGSRRLQPKPVFFALSKVLHSLGTGNTFTFYTAATPKKGYYGVPTCAKELAEKSNSKFFAMNADWEKNGNAAGVMRSQSLIRKIQHYQNPLIILIWDGQDRETYHALKFCVEQKVRYI